MYATTHVVAATILFVCRQYINFLSRTLCQLFTVKVEKYHRCRNGLRVLLFGITPEVFTSGHRLLHSAISIV